MVSQDIVDALNGRLQAFPGLGDVSWEGGVAYEVKVGQPYLSVKLSSYTCTGIGSGIEGAQQHDGTYTITVRQPAGEGRQPAGQIAGALKRFFGRGAVVNTAAGDPVILLNSSEGPALLYGDWVSIPVTVQFVASS